MTPAQFKEIVKEFRQFGYDPYDSESGLEWYACMYGAEGG